VAALALVSICAGVAHAGTRRDSRSLDAGIIARLNAVRVHHHLRRLQTSVPLESAAEQHSLDMAAEGYFSHESPDGTTTAGRLRSTYATGPSWEVGENLLWASPRVDRLRTVSMWMSSDEHRAILLDPRWVDIGCSAVHVDSAQGVYQDLPVTVVTCDFGVRS
jgi:uncharacterized protein YkwD